MTYRNLEELLVKRKYFDEGGLWGWGANTYGQLGDNTAASKSSPVQTVAGGTNWKQVACGNNHLAAIKVDGSLWTWGSDGYGQLGDSLAANKSSPTQTICGGTNWKQVACGYAVTAAVKTDGTLWLCGTNFSGGLGDSTSTSKSSPVQTICGGNNWKQVSCGYYHTAAVKTDGSLWTWGRNFEGQLGDGTVVAQSSPVQTICGGNNWKQVACGVYHVASIKTDGTLWMWGLDTYGQLGDGTVVAKSSPVQTVAGGNRWKHVSAGYYNTNAIKTDGTLWTFGINNFGQLGDGTVTNKSSPVQTVAGGTNWKQTSTFRDSVAAIKTDGTLWSWGRDNSGQLGDNARVNKSSPIQTIAGGTNWKQVACGNSFTTAIQENKW